MKKFLLFTAVVLALSVASCNNSKDYKAQGEELSKQLNEQVANNDTTGVLESDEAIRNLEAEIVATGDSAAIAQFRESMKDARVRNATFITISKMNNGMSKDEALKELASDALKKDINIKAVTSVIDAINKAEIQNEPKE